MSATERLSPRLFTIGVFVVWELACRIFKIDKFILPTPSEAFLAMAQDPAYQADARRVELPVGAPIGGAELAAMIRDLAAETTPAVIAEFTRLAGSK